MITRAELGTRKLSKSHAMCREQRDNVQTPPRRASAARAPKTL